MDTYDQIYFTWWTDRLLKLPLQGATVQSQLCHSHQPLQVFLKSKNKRTKVSASKSAVTFYQQWKISRLPSEFRLMLALHYDLYSLFYLSYTSQTTARPPPRFCCKLKINFWKMWKSILAPRQNRFSLKLNQSHIEFLLIIWHFTLLSSTVWDNSSVNLMVNLPPLSLQTEHVQNLTGVTTVTKGRSFCNNQFTIIFLNLLKLLEKSSWTLLNQDHGNEKNAVSELFVWILSTGINIDPLNQKWNFS